MTTRTARATTVAELEFPPRTNDRKTVEIGSVIAYDFKLPAVLQVAQYG